MKKRLLCVVLTIAILVSLVVPAFAVDTPYEFDLHVFYTWQRTNDPVMRITNVTKVIEPEYDQDSEQYEPLSEEHGEGYNIIVYADAPVTLTLLADARLPGDSYHEFSTGSIVCIAEYNGEMNPAKPLENIIFTGSAEQVPFTTGEFSFEEDFNGQENIQLEIVLAGATWVLGEGVYYLASHWATNEVLLIVGSASESSGSDTAPPPPSDSKPSSWAEVEVNAAIAAGLVPQGLQGNYQSDVSRGDVAAMFINLIEKVCDQTIDDFMDAKGVEINDGAFTDTADRAVLAANALGIINGVGEGLFDPGGTLKRAQIAAIINRAARALDINTEGYPHSFSDVEGHWSDAELGWPASLGIINGYEDGTFRPEGNLTTEQAIAITYRAFTVLTQDSAGSQGGTIPADGNDSQNNTDLPDNASVDLASVISYWTDICNQIIGDTEFDGFLSIVKALEEADSIMQMKYFVLHIPKDMNTIMAGELLQAILIGYGVEFALHIYDNPPPPGSAEVYIEIP